ncbi:MAG TPA: amidohydrolase family protein, partial [Candidatus Acidoferrales bacterium]|nr:amidohydrolase family protein [Candidatus Acidoferrales bacterium]
MEYRYISADNHCDSWWIRKDLFQERLPAKFREAGPRVVDGPDGSFWFWEGKRRRESAQGSGNAAMLKRFYPKANVPAGSMPPTTPKMILEHMDLSRVYAAVFFSDTRKWQIDDLEMHMAVTRVYNDYVMELNAVAPERLMLLPQVPTFSPQHAAGELRRMIEKGVKAVEFHCFDLAQPIYSDAWDETFALASEAGVPLCTHIGDGAGVPYPPNERGSSWAHFSIAPFSIAKYIPQFVFSGAFERYPKLQVSVGECRIGWLPFLFAWMDRQVEIRPPDPTVKLSMMPTEYVKRNMTFTFEEDRVGARMIQYDWSLLKEVAI